MIKIYIQREHLNEADVAAAIGVPEEQMHKIYQSQTVDPDVKKKLEGYFSRNIFDGSILTDYYLNVPDEQANKPKS